MPPKLALGALARLPMRQDEKERPEREQFEETGFVGNIERLLLARDGSASGAACRAPGRLPRAARAGCRSRSCRWGSTARKRPRRPEVLAAAGAVPTGREEDAEADVTLRAIEDRPEHEAIAAEGRQGLRPAHDRHRPRDQA